MLNDLKISTFETHTRVHNVKPEDRIMNENI